MTETVDPWPPYRVGNPDYIHALGVIASVYNLLEFRFRSLFPIYTGIPANSAYVLFAKISNEMRLELIKNAAKFSRHPPEIIDHVHHFLAGFRVCAANRNILMHSTVFFIFSAEDVPCPELSAPGQQPSAMGFQKSPKDNPYQINTYQLTLEEMRTVADSIKAFEVFGDRLYWHILKHHEPEKYRLMGIPADARFALPDKPSLPTHLAPLRLDTQIE